MKFDMKLPGIVTVLCAITLCAVAVFLSCKFPSADSNPYSVPIPDPANTIDSSVYVDAASGNIEALARVLLIDTANTEKHLTAMCELLGLKITDNASNDSTLTCLTPGTFAALAASVRQHRKQALFIRTVDMGSALKIKGAKTLRMLNQTFDYDTTYFLGLMELYQTLGSAHPDSNKTRVARFVSALTKYDPMRPDSLFSYSMRSEYASTLQAYLMFVDVLGIHPMGTGSLFKQTAETKDYFGFGQEVAGQLIDVIGKVGDATGILQGTIVADGTRVKVDGPQYISYGSNQYRYTITTWFEFDYGKLITEHGWKVGVDVPKPGPLKARVKANLSELCPPHALFSEGDPMLMTWVGGLDGGGVSSGDGGTVNFGVTTHQNETGSSCRSYEDRIIIEVMANAQEWSNWAAGIGSTLFPKYEIKAIFVKYLECTDNPNPDDSHL